MDKKDAAELKRRFKKEGNSFTRIAGCYVNSEKEKVTTFNQLFGNLEDEELHKYLEIANKCLSGTIGNNLMEHEFPLEEEEEGGRQHLLNRLRSSGLKDEDLLNEFYDMVIASYEYIGNYLILVYHDAYDVPLKTSDNMTLDDSEEVYEYIVCAICPVNLSKSGLGYREDENRIGALLREWTVNPVDTAFIFPSFTDRSQDIHHILFYAKNPKAPHKEFWENGFHVESKFTSDEKRAEFEGMIEKSLGGDDDENKEQMLDVEDELNNFINTKAEHIPDDEAVTITGPEVQDVMIESGLSEQKAERIRERFENFFPPEEDAPLAEELLDKRALKDNEIRHEKKALQQEVVRLNTELKNAGVITEDGSDVSVVIKVPPERADQITASFIDGRRSIVIPLDDDDMTSINGERKIL